VFSPYYAWARDKDPENHCAINLALYGAKPRWAMTERGRKSLSRTPETLRIGPSALRWDAGTLTAEIDEIGTPLPRRLRGTIRLSPRAIQPATYTLDAAGRHRWRPVAPSARIEVAFSHPAMSWQGAAYFDTNDGDAPLAQDFAAWHWSRTADGKILYDVQRRDGTRHCLALQIGPDGAATSFAPPPEQPLPATLWRIARRTRADAPPRVLKTLEDAPFYARSHIATRINGVASEAIHESLSLDRFAAPWVRALLPFRMPRF
jgi:carotenoid 1,2-hydratase